MQNNKKKHLQLQTTFCEEAAAKQSRMEGGTRKGKEETMRKKKEKTTITPHQRLPLQTTIPLKMPTPLKVPIQATKALKTALKI